MVSEETIKYFSNWDKRILVINLETLDGLFDKYAVLFIAFNRLYNEACEMLIASGIITKPRIADWEKAIVIPVEFLGADEIISVMNKSNQISNINTVVKLIEDRAFSINLINGKHNEDADNQLKENLRSTDTIVQAKAILNLIYQVRNNLIHGQKHFHEHQRLLLEPVISLLEVILMIMRSKMMV